MSPEKACPSQIVNRPTRPLRSDDLRVGISPAQTIQTGRVRPLEPGEGALTEEQVEHCLDVTPIAAVGPAGVGIVVESSTSCRSDAVDPSSSSLSRSVATSGRVLRTSAGFRCGVQLTEIDGDGHRRIRSASAEARVSPASSRSSTATTGGTNLPSNAIGFSTTRRTTSALSAIGSARYSERVDVGYVDVDVSLVRPSNASAVMDRCVGAPVAHARVVVDAAVEGGQDSDPLVAAASPHDASEVDGVIDVRWRLDVEHALPRGTFGEGATTPWTQEPVSAE